MPACRALGLRRRVHGDPGELPRRLLVRLPGATTLIIGAAYTLWHGQARGLWGVANDKVAKLQDVNGREALVLTTLAIAVLLLGLWPQPLIELMDASVEHLLRHIAVSKL